MSSSQQVFDSLVRHQIFLLRRAGGINNDLLGILKEMSSDIETRLEGHVTRYQQTKLRLLYTDINQVIDAAEKGFYLNMKAELEDLVDYEARFTINMLNKHVDFDFALPPSSILGAVTANTTMELLVGDKLQKFDIDSMVANFANSQKKYIRKQIRREIQKGLLEGKTSAQIAKEIGNLAYKRSRANAYAVVRTATNAITGAARREVYRANADVISGNEWVSTLDSRTTLECARRDGLIYPLDDTPSCPRHWNCRSLVVPVIKDRYSIISDRGKRASINGPIDASTAYEGWIKRQPAAFQDEFLGKARGKLFRANKMRLEQFVDDSGRTLTLKELSRLEGITI